LSLVSGCILESVYCSASVSSICSQPIDASVRLSLITFGAPPVTDINLTPHLLRLQQTRDKPGLMLAVANEFDPVVRADRSYLLSLIELHRSAGRAASLADVGDSLFSNSASTTQD